MNDFDQKYVKVSTEESKDPFCTYAYKSTK